MKLVFLIFSFSCILFLGGCFSSSSPATAGDDGSVPQGLVMRLPATNLVQLQIDIFEFWPQQMYAGRGYSFEGRIDRDGKIFGPVTTEFAQTDLKLAALQFCKFAGGGLSRFYNYSDSSSGLAEHRIYFNCT